MILFSTTGKTAAGFSIAKKRADKLMHEAANGLAIAPWRLHDLRRTATSGMASLGSSQITIEKVLNHSSKNYRVLLPYITVTVITRKIRSIV